MTITVNLIGNGRIGSAVAAWLSHAPGYRLGTLIGRTTEGWKPAEIAIDTAGPAALRGFGPELLAAGEVWTVGAVALIDAAFRGRMEAIALKSGHRLRLFTPWIAGADLARRDRAAWLHVTQTYPQPDTEPGTVFHGPLVDAAERFPNHLNTACAAALTGPGIEATTVELIVSPPGGPHVIRSRLQIEGSTITSEVSLDGTGPHPVAAAIIAALQRRGEWLCCA